MSYFGIPGYAPVWMSGAGLVSAAHGGRLQSLVGRNLDASWLVWDRKYGKWFNDCPVVLDFGGEQLEICHQKFDELSLTWNTITAAAPIDWTIDEDEGAAWGPIQLEWRNDLIPELAARHGCRVDRVDVLEWCGNPNDFAYGALAISVTLGGTLVVVHNGLDENALSFGDLGPSYRRV